MRERLWCAEMRHPGLRPFWFGAVVADGEEHARGRLLAAWASISPHPSPEIVAVHPGELVMVPDDV
jgi:hypothetical protein